MTSWESLPSSVTAIGDEAFMDCGKLASVTMESVAPPAIGNHAFHAVASTFSIHVPNEASLAQYRAAKGWTDYSSALTTP